MGADYIETPNMDLLATNGTLFTAGYVPENHCRPSLQTLMTGTLPIDYNQQVDSLMKNRLKTMRFASEESMEEWKRNFKHHAMKEFTTLPKLLATKGYKSFQGGKWWEFHYENGGFTHGMTKGWTPEERKNGGKWFKQFMGGDGLKLARATMQPVYDFINEHGEDPFFIWYAPELPHYPFNAPEKYYNIYEGKKNMSESAKRYYANCTWFDDGVGALTTYLKEKGHHDNTLYVYVNDNGWEQNPDQEFRHDSLRWHNGGDKGKLSMYDQSFRTPIIFSWEKQIKKGKKKTNLVHSADIPATILDYLDIDIPENFHGQSVKNIIEDKQSTFRSTIIGDIHKIRSEDDMMGKDIQGYWLRNAEYFFNWDQTNQVKKLYNLQKDPSNNNDKSHLHPDLVNDYSQQIEQWIKEKNHIKKM